MAKGILDINIQPADGREKRVSGVRGFSRSGIEMACVTSTCIPLARSQPHAHITAREDGKSSLAVQPGEKGNNLDKYSSSVSAARYFTKEKI